MNDLKNVRGPLPLDDANFAAIRANVMAKIGAKRPRPFAWYFAFAASVAIAVLSIVVATQPAVKPATRPLTRPSATLSPLRGARALEALLPREREKVPLSERSESKGRMRVVRKHPHRPTPPAVARMEIQTSDPDVRIIWITN